MTGSGHRPLAGRSIVITRSVADNRSLAEALQVLGAEVVPVPLVEVLPAPDGGAALRDAVDRLEQYRWVVLTSVNAADALAAALADRPAGAAPRQWPNGLLVAPVGPTTQAAAKTNGWPTAAPPPEAAAESLVASFPKPSLDSASGPVRILAPLAELASDTVVVGLEALGYSVDRVTAYRTAAPVDHPSEGHRTDGHVTVKAVEGSDAVVFFSPSAVDRFADRFDGTTWPAVVVCIGPSTAARATERGMTGIVTAAVHTESGVLQAVQEALASAM